MIPIVLTNDNDLSFILGFVPILALSEAGFLK